MCPLCFIQSRGKKRKAIPPTHKQIYKTLSLSLPSTRLLVPLLARSGQSYFSLLFLILSLSLHLSFVSHDGGSHARDSPDGPSFSLQPLLLSTCGEEERILLDAIAQTKCVLL